MTPARSRMRSRRGMRKRLKMRSPTAEYAVRNCAAPTNGARILKASRSRKCPWSRFFASATRRPSRFPGPRADEHGARPLSGVRVLDLTRVLAGPTCARTLAEHGAEVLHVRSPKLPSIEPFVIDTNPGKRSCFLDLDRREDVERMRALVRDAHVFSQGYRPGALARRGFSPEELAQMRPGIIAVSIDCYGHEGPFAGRPGWEQLAQTVTGMAHEHAGDEHPALVPAAINDYTTGYLGALGVMCALARRTTEGGSWHVRVSLARTCDVDHVVAAHRAG